jgi:hypothetical protein
MFPNQMFTDEEFNNAKSRDSLKFKCQKCGEEFYRLKHRIQVRIKNSKESEIEFFQFCGKKCFGVNRKESGLVSVTCAFCKNKFMRKGHQNKSENCFCSRSCSNSFNNIKYPKRHKSNKCKFCGTLIESVVMFCEECIKNGKHVKGGKFLLNRTLKDAINNYKGPSKFNGVREHARNITKDITKCSICGYSHHVETCHIKPISSFDLDEKLSIVNNSDNLVVLCRNHHWELDHGILKLK